MKRLLVIALLCRRSRVWLRRRRVKTLLDASTDQFCKDSADKGVDGWLAYFADDAVGVLERTGRSRAAGRRSEAHYRQAVPLGKSAGHLDPARR